MRLCRHRLAPAFAGANANQSIFRNIVLTQLAWSSQAMTG
jgi:hypothetical protein